MSSTYPFRLQRLDNFTEFLVIENAFLPHQINRINEHWDHEKSRVQEAALEGSSDLNTDDNLRKSKVLSITPSEQNSWVYRKLQDLAHQGNHHSYHFDLSGFYEPLQLAQYHEGDFFDWHLDFGIGDSSTRKLSISIQLSDPTSYEGGLLQFRINNQVIDASSSLGTAIIFPSFLMHRVTRITAGSRRSLVGWVSGNHFR